MCGPLRLVVGERLGQRVAYQGGRLAAYLALGLLAGSVGGALPRWLLATVVVIVAIFSLGSFAPLPGARSWQRARQRWVSAASAQPALLGLVSGLLPCGMLHAWVLVAAAAASPSLGAAVLGVLWLGTLPALEVGAFALRRPLSALRIRFPRAFPLFFLALSLAPLLWRGGMARPVEASEGLRAPVYCHGERVGSGQTHTH